MGAWWLTPEVGFGSYQVEPGGPHLVIFWFKCFPCLLRILSFFVIPEIKSSAGEYRSRSALFGVPLVHARFSSPEESDGPVFGWLAGGDRAYGLLFAWGGYAVAPFSVGAIAIGLFAVGTLSVGVISLGTAGVGLSAVGCMAVGVKAYAWLSALGWETAQGSGFAIARIAAEGPVAFAQHANDRIARQLLADPHAEHTQTIILIVIT